MKPKKGGTGGWLHGIHAVKGLLERRPDAVQAVWLAEGAGAERLATIEALARRQRIQVGFLPPDELDRRAEGARHQGVIAQFDPDVVVLGEAELDALLEVAAGPPLLLVLDGVQDPHNLGACLRSADAAGADAVIVPKDRAAGMTAAVCKVASGAVGHVPFVRVTNLARTLRRLRDADIWIAGADVDGDTSLFEADLRLPVALVLGAEGSGLRRLTREHCDFRLSIPMQGVVESLNISVAAAVCLFEARRQRGAG
jgi:23S rRNA (guanosine2251-2'-O)-methyltransferase